MSTVARPAIFTRVFDDTCPGRIQLNIPEASQEISALLHDTGLEPSLEQGATAGIGVIEMTHIKSPKKLHQLRQAAVGSGCGQKMHMIGHKDIGMDTAIKFGCRLLQVIQIASVILFGIVARLAIITALYYMLWITNQIKARLAWHYSPPCE